MSAELIVRRFGSLTCRVVQSANLDTTQSLLVILNHGFGASGEDLVDFAPWLMDASAAVSDRVRFVFPEAPIDLAPAGMPGGRAWWPINMAKLAEMNQTRDFSELTHLDPPGMQQATSLLATAVQEMRQEWQLAESQCVLGGFSQGAMVSTNLTLESALQPALLVLFSGTLLHRERWRQLAQDHPGCPVLQFHGDQDQILPIQPARELSELLSTAGFSVEFQQFRGPHTIPMQALGRFQERLEQILADR